MLYCGGKRFFMSKRIGFKRSFILLVCLVLAASPLLGCAELERENAGASIIISEICSSNKRSLVDENVGSPDWIELYNSSESEINLAGYALSDNYRSLHKFVFDETAVIAPHGYLVVFCGDNNGSRRTEVPCTGFGLSKNGDYLFMTDQYFGLLEQIEIPELYTDVTYARRSDGTFGYCAVPTPGAENTGVIADNLQAVLDTSVSDSLRISEICPRTADGSSPWVELVNTGTKSVTLADFYLSDSEMNLTRWQMPDSVVAAGGCAVIELSGLGKSATGGIHSDFKLSKDDTGLFLCDRNGDLLDEAHWDGRILKGLSVLRAGDGVVYTAEPTKGGTNSSSTFASLDENVMTADDPIHINEVLTKNTLSITDSDGDRTEWVELRNTSSNTVSLAGYYLSDNRENLFKWALPSVELAPGAYLVIFLSGKDRVSGELHASFRLGADEDTLYLTTLSGLKTEAFSLEGTGLKDVSVGPDADGTRRFYPEPTPGAKNAQGFLTADEIGCFDTEGVFISEVSAIPAVKSGNLDWIELHNGGAEMIDLAGWYLSDDETNPTLFRIPSLVIPAGGYGIVQTTTHELRRTEQIAPFGIGTGGETLILSDPQGNAVDRFTTGAMRQGVSAGRIETDNSVNRVFFTEATPGERNSTAYAFGYASKPAISETMLYHSEPFAVELSVTSPQTTIRYTLDGSTPNERSAVYDAPITIQTNTVLRAAGFCDGLLRSDVAMATYLFDEPHTVAVVCVNGDEKNIREVMRVDDKDEKVEREAVISFYEPDGTLGVTFPAGIKPKGAGTVAYRQKSLSINLRAGYGQSSVTYPFFPGYAFTSFGALVVRNGGQDWSAARMRDPYCMALVQGMNVDASATRLCVVYINGVYNGLYNLGEDQNSEYLDTHYGIDGDNVDIIRRNETAIAGDNKDIKRVHQYALDTDLSDDALFAEYETMIDVDYFTDYFIAQTYFCNSDMFNQKYWRSRDNALRWRPIFYDLDFGFKNSADRTILGMYFREDGVESADKSKTYFEFYIGLEKNAAWRKKCFERYVEVVQTYFNADRAARILDEMADEMRPEMERQIRKWGKPNSMRAWEDEVAKLRRIATSRPQYALEQAMKFFGFNEAYLAELMAKYPVQP